MTNGKLLGNNASVNRVRNHHLDNPAPVPGSPLVGNAPLSSQSGAMLQGHVPSSRHQEPATTTIGNHCWY